MGTSSGRELVTGTTSTTMQTDLLSSSSSSTVCGKSLSSSPMHSSSTSISSPQSSTTSTPAFLAHSSMTAIRSGEITKSEKEHSHYGESISILYDFKSHVEISQVLDSLSPLPFPESDVLRSARQASGLVPSGLHQIYETMEKLLLQVEPKNETSGINMEYSYVSPSIQDFKNIG